MARASASKGAVLSKSLSEAAARLEKNMRYYRLRNTVDGPESADVSWVMDSTSRVYLVWLEAMDVDGEVLSHAVVTNATSSLVLDSVERLAM